MQQKCWARKCADASFMASGYLLKFSFEFRESDWITVSLCFGETQQEPLMNPRNSKQQQASKKMFSVK